MEVDASFLSTKDIPSSKLEDPLDSPGRFRPRYRVLAFRPRLGAPSFPLFVKSGDTLFFYPILEADSRFS